MKFLNPFFVLTALAWTVMGGLLFTFNRTKIQLAFDGIHNSWGDTFFPFITHWGDGAVFVLGLIFLFIRYKDFFAVLFSSLLTLVVAGVLKNFVFAGSPRPAKYFPEGMLHFVEGVDMHLVNSFPSGHTMAAFAFWGVLSLILPKDKVIWKFLFFIIAILVGLSRVYLHQHFLIDVWAGMALGLTIAYLSLFLSQLMTAPWVERKIRWGVK